MKKVMILLVIALTANVMMAQKKDRTDAFMYNKNGQYAKAMASIEKCINHEQFLGMKPNDQSQAWLYRASIYQNILQSDDEKLKAEVPNALEIVYESLMKCLENESFLEDEQIQMEIGMRIASVMTAYYSQGADAYNNGQFAEAAPLFKKAYDIAASLGGGEQASEMLNLAATAALRAEDYNTALKYFTELKNNGNETAEIYRHLAACYNGLGQSEQAMEMINAGLAIDPSDPNLILEKVNAYLKEGKGAEAVADLEKLLELDKNNAQLLFVLGTIYGDDSNSGDKIIGANESQIRKAFGNPVNVDKTTTELGTGVWWTYDGDKAVHFMNGKVDIVRNMPENMPENGETKNLYDPDKALQYYEQALAINPEYYDATYNIGVLYTTMANKYIEQANDITGFSKAEQEQYNSLIEQANELLRTGLPYLKKAYEAQPSDDVKNVLRSIYVKLNMTDEVKALDGRE